MDLIEELEKYEEARRMVSVCYKTMLDAAMTLEKAEMDIVLARGKTLGPNEQIRDKRLLSMTMDEAIEHIEAQQAYEFAKGELQIAEYRIASALAMLKGEL